MDPQSTVAFIHQSLLTILDFPIAEEFKDFPYTMRSTQSKLIYEKTINSSVDDDDYSMDALKDEGIFVDDVGFDSTLEVLEKSLWNPVACLKDGLGRITRLYPSCPLRLVAWVYDFEVCLAKRDMSEFEEIYYITDSSFVGGDTRTLLKMIKYCLLKPNLTDLNIIIEGDDNGVYFKVLISILRRYLFGSCEFDYQIELMDSKRKVSEVLKNQLDASTGTGDIAKLRIRFANSLKMEQPQMNREKCLVITKDSLKLKIDVKTSRYSQIKWEV